MAPLGPLPIVFLLTRKSNGMDARMTSARPIGNSGTPLPQVCVAQ